MAQFHTTTMSTNILLASCTAWKESWVCNYWEGFNSSQLSVVTSVEQNILNWWDFRHSQHHWTPPKGHLDQLSNGDWEEELVAALRETEEEAGIGKHHLEVKLPRLQSWWWWWWLWSMIRSLSNVDDIYETEEEAGIGKHHLEVYLWRRNHRNAGVSRQIFKTCVVVCMFYSIWSSHSMSTHWGEITGSFVFEHSVTVKHTVMIKVWLTPVLLFYLLTIASSAVVIVQVHDHIKGELRYEAWQKQKVNGCCYWLKFVFCYCLLPLVVAINLQ